MNDQGPPSQAADRAELNAGMGRLGSWKEIANYMGRTVRTVQRWEKKQGLPVRRLQHDSGSTVYAFKKELDRWHLRSSLVVHEPRKNPREPVVDNTSAGTEDTSPADPVSDGARVIRRRGRFWLLDVALAAIAITVVVSALYFNQTGSPPPDRMVSGILTTDPGDERFPALSADGRQVAYTWDGNGEQVDIYLKLVGANEHIRLTNDADIEESPAWSPDGLSIAYLRRSGPAQRELCIISAIGGKERVITNFAVPLSLDDARSIAASIDWSVDGDWLAVTQSSGKYDSMGIVAIDINTGRQRVLTQPDEGVHDLNPRFSPDGEYLSFTRSVSPLKGQIHVMKIDLDSNGQGRVWTLPGASDWNSDAEWSADGHKLVFSSGRWPRVNLWEVRADGTQQPRPLAGIGQGGSQPSIAPVTAPGGETGAWRMVYMVNTLENDIWQVDLDSDNSPTVLLSSSQRERFPAYGQDGRISFLSDRSGNREVWVADRDGSDSQQWTRWESAYIWRPSFSPDGSLLAYTVEIDNIHRLYVQDKPLAPARALAPEGISDVDLAWSRDGRRIYTASTNRGGLSSALWAMELTDGSTTLLAEGPLVPLGEGPAGRWLWMQRTLPTNDHRLERLDLQSGDIEVIGLSGDKHHSFTLGPDGVYFVSLVEDGYEIHRWDWQSAAQVPVRRLGYTPETGMAISPDGAHALLARITLQRSDLMVSDGNL